MLIILIVEIVLVALLIFANKSAKKKGVDLPSN